MACQARGRKVRIIYYQVGQYRSCESVPIQQRETCMGDVICYSR